MTHLVTLLRSSGSGLIKILALLVAIMMGAGFARAQVSFTGAYTENFNGMGTSGTAAPAGWTVHGALGGDKDTWSAANGLPASGTVSAGTAGTVNATLVVNSNAAAATATSNTQGYNFALTESTSDRAIGSSPTSGAGIILQLRLTNNSGAAVDRLRISYDIRRFRTVTTAEDFPGYRLFVSSDNGATWSNATQLNTSLSGGDWNVPSSSGVTSVGPRTVILPSAVANGAEIRLRWVDDNGPPSPDQIVGLDNVAVSVPQPAPTVTLTAPVPDATFNLPANIQLEAAAADANGSVTKVEFFANGTKVGEDTTAPYVHVWSGMISGTYSIVARATDDEGDSTDSTPVPITVSNPGNVVPSVTLVTPLNGALIAGDGTVLSATASDTDGVISKVEFYQGTTKIGEATSSPYQFNWTGVTTGSYLVKARAIDNDGAFTDSAVAEVTFVVPIQTTSISRRPAGQPGSVWKYLDNGTDQGTAWKEPAFDDSAWASGAAPLGYGDTHIVTTVFSPPTPNRYITTYFRRTFNLTGAAAVQSILLNVLRDDGVVVYINGVEVARQNMPEGPINYLTNSASIADGANETTYFPSNVTTLPPLNEGENVIAVELHQRDGNSSDLGFDLELITNSLPGTPPTIQLTSPATGAPFTAPATVAIAANADDSDGSVAKVEFFNGTEKLGEDAEAPFTFSWTMVPQGDYTLTARATDNYGLTTTSDPVSIQVGAPNTIFPTVTITSPANGAEYLSPATVSITATANDADGTVSKVEFFNGTAKLGEDAAAPYEFVWTNVPVGSYTLTARATDNLTAATTSAPVVVDVRPNLAPSVTLATPLDAATGLGGAGRVNLTANVSDPESLPLHVTFYGRPASAPPGEDFTIVTLPDTQFYSENSGGSRFALFQSQTNWIVASKDLLNTKFVAHMGDMVNTASVAQEWTNAKLAMSVIEDPLTTLLAQGMPWGGAPGNHDGTGTEWDTHFGPARFAGKDYYQGNYNNSNRNNYQFFSAGGMDFIIINLAYNSNTGGNQAVMDWADALLKAHPNRRGIVTSHWLIGTSFPPAQSSWGGHGQAVYDNLKDNPNLFLMLCGHIHGEGRRADVFEGRTVNTVLQDYQSRSNGGDSWLRYFTFKPSENKIYAYTYKTNTAPTGSPMGGTFETDADSQFTLDYNMAATAPWVDLGTVSLAAGETTATLPWTGLTSGAEYEWYAAVSDGVTPVGSASRSFTTGGNAAPTITMTSPANGASVKRPATVDFTALASDLDGTIARVEFYHGTTKIGEDETAPYTFSWDAPTGDHVVSARVIDNEGASTDSATASVSVRLDITPAITGTGGTVSGGQGLIAGESATFVATPRPGFHFRGWVVNGSAAGSDLSLTVTAAEGMQLEATFAVSLLITEIQSNQASAGTNDYWELTNIGPDLIDLAGWKWDDDSRNPSDPAAVTVPSGTLIEPGESIIFSPLGAAAFRTWWGIPTTVQVITGGPGLGGNDGIALFDPSGEEYVFFRYAAGGFTRSDGSASLGGHAGASAGGTATQALVLDPSFGAAQPRYQAAVAGVNGAFASTVSASDVGSPGFSGLPVSARPSILLTIGSTTVATGGVTTLQVRASGAPTPDLQWYRGESGDISQPIVDADEASLLTAPLTATTAYWVRATNDLGTADSATITVTVVDPVTSIDLSNYVRVGRYGLPEPLRTALPAGTPAHNLLCQEASGVAYNWDTDTLFIVADGGRSVTQVSKTGLLIDTMTLALGSSPQGTEFYDIEGITYVGGGQFVMAEERDRQLVKFTYAAGTTLTRGQTQTVKIGTFVDNTGTEGLSYDPLTGGFIVLKEISPIGIFQTTVDFALGTASNGSPSTVNSTNLFDPALLGMTDVADVFALSLLPSMAGQPQQPNLIVLSQEDGKLVNIDRSGVISSTRQLFSDPGNPLSVAGQQHEGVTMDAAGFLYIVNENGGGGIDFPELWVYAPATAPNAAPTGLSVNGAVTSVIENSSTASRLRLGEVVVIDDGLGTNILSLAGADAAFFELDGNTLFLKAGTVLDFETKSSYQINLQVDDTSVGVTPDATEPFTLTVIDQEPETLPPPALLITEVAPWASGNSPVGSDWFEVTNISPDPIDITGWKMDDNSKAFGSAVALNGITSIAPGESVIFLETNDLAGKAALFLSRWFGANPPAGLQIGNYTGSGVGLGTGGDAVWLFDAGGQIQCGVTFGSSPGASPYATFDNTRGLNDSAISTLSRAGINGAKTVGDPAVSLEVGSPGFAAPGLLRITEVAPWSSGNSPVGADWFEVTNVGARVVSLTGWTMDDSSESNTTAVALNGIAAIAPGESVIFLETETVSATVTAFLSNWFGANPPSGLQVGTYNGSGVGLSTGGDAVNLFNSKGVRQAKVTFGASPSGPYGTFDNSAAIDNAAITLFSTVGVNGAVAAANSPSEIGSPGTLVATITPSVSGGVGGSVTGGGSLPVGSPVTFTATADTGYEFSHWLVNGSVFPETAATLNLTVTSGLEVEAVFVRSSFTLQLLHFADAEAGLLASQTAPNLAALVDAFEETYANTIILAGGDNYIPGPFAAAGTDAIVAATHDKGNNPFAADIEIHNRIGVQASTVGNHEFDFGTNAFSDAINDANFPYLTANLDFSGDSGISARYQETVGVGGLEEASTLAKKIVPSAVITVNGEKIGLVGATTQIIEGISSTGGVEVKGFAGDGSETNDMTLLASQLQPVINDLTGQGVNKIVLMAHLQQITLEQSLAPLLTGVDIVLAAGSNTRLGDADDVAVAFPGHAADFAGTYPILTAGADAKPVLIVNTDNEFTYLGRLVVDFDGNGEIKTSELPGRVPVNGAYAATSANVAAAWGVSEGNLATTAFAAGTKGAGVKQITDAVQSVIAAKDGDVKGYTNHYLEGERNFVRNQETNLGNLSADANAFVLAEATGDTLPIVSLKNGGGIRAAIGSVEVGSGAKNPPLANPSAGKAAGGVSLLDIENSMRFNNRLLAFETTPAGLKAILEHGVALLGNQGRFPQIGGVSFAYDPARTAGDRITTLSLIGEEGQLRYALYDNGTFSPWAPPVIRLVTLNFLANGGDGYPMKANGTNFRYLLDDGTLGPILDPALDFTAAPSLPANALGEQKALADFLAGRHATPATAYDVADTGPADDLRIQNLASRSNAVPFDIELLLSGNGTGGLDEELAAGETQGIRFSVAATRIVEISAGGATGLEAELLDASGAVVASFSGSGPLRISRILGAGDYLLRLANPGATSRSLLLSVDASVSPVSRPDAAVGTSLGRLRGVRAYGPVAGQTQTLTSRKLRPVRGVAVVANRGTLNEALLVSGSGSSKRFRVTYTRGSANVTSQMATGRYRTPVLGASSAAVVINASITPVKSRLQVRRPGRPARIVETFFNADIRARSTSTPGLGDTARLRVQTKR